MLTRTHEREQTHTYRQTAFKTCEMNRFLKILKPQSHHRICCCCPSVSRDWRWVSSTWMWGHCPTCRIQAFSELKLDSPNLPSTSSFNLLSEVDWPSTFPIPSEAFRRYDESDDSNFYDQVSRLMFHDHFISLDLSPFYLVFFARHGVWYERGGSCSGRTLSCRRRSSRSGTAVMGFSSLSQLSPCVRRDSRKLQRKREVFYLFRASRDYFALHKYCATTLPLHPAHRFCPARTHSKQI